MEITVGKGALSASTTHQNDQQASFTSSWQYRQCNDKRGVYESTIERETENREAIDRYTKKFMEDER